MIFKDRPVVQSEAEIDAISQTGICRVINFTSDNGYPSDCILCSIHSNTCDSTIQITFNYRAETYIRVNWYGNWNKWKKVSLA